MVKKTSVKDKDASLAQTESSNKSTAFTESKEYTRSLIESNIDVLITTDSLGIINDVNRQFCELTGISQDELLGSPFKTYFTDPKHADDLIRKVLSENRIANYELIIKSLNSHKSTPVSFNATTFRTADGHLKGIFATARDITEQKRLEKESREQTIKLQEATSFLSNVLESSTAYSIIAEDLEGNILAWNEGARLNYGYTAEEMIGKQNTRILRAPEEIKSGRLQAVIAAALKTGKKEGVLESVRKNGERFTSSLALTLRKDASGNPVGYLLISKDITDQQREEALVTKNIELIKQNRLSQEANRLKSEFLANMSHELRSPLNGIIGFAELMYLGKVGPVSPEHKEYLGDILTSSRHLLQLINDILDLAKVESGKMEFNPEKIHISHVISEVCDILQTLIIRRNIKLTIHIDPSLITIIIDPAKLKQVLYNYISNALKFTNEGGSVTIRVTPEGTDFFRLVVEDNGIGIRKEDIPKLFTEFQQLDASLDKKYQGTGLGLALTKRIAEALGGQVGVKSKLNEGSRFYIVLPKAPKDIDLDIVATHRASRLADKPTSSTASKRHTTTAAPTIDKHHLPTKNKVATARASAKILVISPTILVIDDDPKDNAMVSKTLTDAGYTVEVALTGADGIKCCQEKHFNVITLDLLLPDMNGWDVLRAVRSKGLNLDTPTVIVSIVGSKAESFGHMIQHFLTKPIKSDVLIKAIQQTGIYPNQNKTILFVDDDPQMLTLCTHYLKNYGSTILCERDPVEALKIANRKQPDLIILDLLMPRIDGLEFLRRFRLSKHGQTTPVIICTSQDIGEVDRKRIKASVAAVVKKGEGSMSRLITELKHIYPLNKET